MSLILLTLWTVVVLCNVYVGYCQIQLFHKGLVHAQWRLGTGLLDAALQEATDQKDIQMIRRGKMMFRLSVMAFIPFILLALWQIYK